MHSHATKQYLRKIFIFITDYKKCRSVKKRHFFVCAGTTPQNKRAALRNFGRRLLVILRAAPLSFWAKPRERSAALPREKKCRSAEGFHLWKAADVSRRKTAEKSRSQKAADKERKDFSAALTSFVSVEMTAGRRGLLNKKTAKS